MQTHHDPVQARVLVRTKRHGRILAAGDTVTVTRDELASSTGVFCPLDEYQTQQASQHEQQETAADATAARHRALKQGFQQQAKAVADAAAIAADQRAKEAATIAEAAQKRSAEVATLNRAADVQTQAVPVAEPRQAKSKKGEPGA